MIVGYTMLHYGKDYLAYALQSLRDYVDKHVILYSPTPTFGSHTDLPCPDSRDELYAIAKDVLGNKLAWFEGYRQNYEVVANLYLKAKLIMEVDADEVWTPGLVASVLRRYHDRGIAQGSYRMPMIHHWRSFGYVCKDGLWPTRMHVVGQETIPTMWPYGGAPVHHFGYARAVSDTHYKIETSAHRGEWRDGWFDNVFLNFPARLTDLHPVVKDMWNAEHYDRSKLPDFMKSHPWFNAEVIQ